MRLTLRAFAPLLTFALAAPVSAAHAHPRLLKATPAADSRSADAPRQVVLTFNESLDLALTRVTIIQNGSTVRAESLRLAADDDKTVIAPLDAALSPGRYTVRWQVTGDDGHPVRGEFSFEVLAAGAAPINRESSRSSR